MLRILGSCQPRISSAVQLLIVREADRLASYLAVDSVASRQSSSDTRQGGLAKPGRVVPRRTAGVPRPYECSMATFLNLYRGLLFVVRGGPLATTGLGTYVC